MPQWNQYPRTIPVTAPARAIGEAAGREGRMPRRATLFRKYATFLVSLVGGALLASGAIGLNFSYRETRDALLVLEREKAQAASVRIEQFVREIERQLGWTTFPSSAEGAAAIESRRLDLLKLMRQVPAVMDAAYIDGDGREQVRLSRLTMDVVGSGKDWTADTRFVGARKAGTHFGAVHFRKESEPYMSIAARAERGGGVTAAEVNLKFIWDVITQIRIGATGLAYVVGGDGSLISHPDISLVLRKTDMSVLPQVQAVLSGSLPERAGYVEGDARDIAGRPVLAAYARIEPLGWALFVEQSQEEALAPLYASMLRHTLILAAGLVLAMLASLLLARRMTRPIKALREGAAAIGAGDLDHRIGLATGDELQELADQFNQMASDLKALGRVERLKRFLPPQVAEVIAEETPASLETHRREVVVVFLDLRGFTSFTETSEPEEVMGVLHAYHEAMGRLILRYEGTLERFLGDGIMILFNAPITVSDPALRALRMAVDMHAEFARLAEGWAKQGFHLHMGIGIAQGYATLGIIGFEGRQDYSAIGTVCNLAARLCAEAKGGQTLVPGRVLSGIEALVDAEPVGELTLKGMSRPVDTWNVVRVRA